MAQELLTYFAGDFSDRNVDALKSLVGKLAEEELWSNGPPRFVDDLDASSCTTPEDEPLRTVGLALVISVPGDPRTTPVTEPRRIVEELSKFSAQHGVEFEMQLGDTYVGEIRNGVPDHLIRDGLLGQW